MVSFYSRYSTTTHNKPSSIEDIQRKKCISWIKRSTVILEINDESVKLPEQMHLKDEIYTRVVELENDKSVFGADLYYDRARLPN